MRKGILAVLVCFMLIFSAGIVAAETSEDSNFVVDVASAIWNWLKGAFGPTGAVISDPANCPADMISYWGFDGNANDDYGSNDGTNYGAVWTSGQVGGAIEVDGTTHVEVGDPANLRDLNSGAYTVSAWVYMNTNDGTDTIVSKLDEIPNPAEGWTFYSTWGGELRFLQRCANNGHAISSSDVNIPLNTWTHVAATYDNNGDRMGRLYINGVETGYLQRTACSGAVASDTGTPLKIARGDTLGGGGTVPNPFDGKIDEVAIFNRELSSSEISDMYNNGISGEGYCPAAGNVCDTGLVNYWTFDDQGNPVQDDYGSDDGTNNGATWTSGGQVSGAMTFDGVNDMVTFANSVANFGTDDFTLAMWARRDGPDQFRPFGKMDGGGQNGYYVSLWPTMTGFSNANAGNYKSLMNVTPTNEGQWYHIVTTRENGVGKLYIDGVLAKTGDVNHDISTNEPVRVGWFYYGGQNYYYEGTLDEVAVFDRAVTGTEVQDMYNNGLVGLGYCEVASDCGNGNLDAGEECDDGNTVDDDCCTNSCVLTPQGDGLVSHWTFDDQADPVKDDFDANHGTNNGAVWTSSGQVGGAMTFDGVDDYVDFGSASSLDITGPITVETWIKPDAISDRLLSYFVSKSVTNDGWAFGFLGTHTLCGGVDGIPFVYSFTHPSTVVCAATAMTVGNWYHLAFTNDGTTTEVYVNGVLEASSLHDWVEVPGANLNIGRRNDNKFYTDGSMDEVVIYNKVLSGTKIQQHYQKGLNNLGICEALAPVCGNGIVEGTEECDDGNIVPGDGCDASCNFEFEDCGSINNLVSYWTLDDQANPGLDIADANDGVNNGATWTAGGQVDGALHFDGVNDHVSVANAANLNFGSAGDFSITAWVNFDPSITDNDAIINKETGYYGNGYMIYVEKNEAIDQAHPGFHVESGGVPVYASTPDFPYGEWHHVAAVADRDQHIKIYLDGQLVDTDTGITSLGNIDNSNSLFIGTQPTTGTDVHFNGKIDDVMIFNAALSDAEVSNIYSKGVSGQQYCSVSVCGNGIVEGTEECDDGNLIDGDGCSSTCTEELVGCPADLLSYWTFDDQNDPVKDDFDGHDGTNQGAVWTSSGQVGGAMSFDGNLDVVKAGDVPEFNFGLDDFTIEAWVKWEGPMGTVPFGRIVSKQYPVSGCDGATLYILAKTIDDKLVFRAQDCEEEVAIDAKDSGAIVQNTWYHVVAVRDGGNIYLYKDGVLVGSETSGRVDTLNPIGGDFAIGNYGITPQSSNAWNGKIDEVAIYDRALDSTEILQHYNNGLMNLAYCPLPECGNNITELGEECDDGNTQDGDGCSSTCTEQLVGCPADLLSYWTFDDQSDPVKDDFDGHDGMNQGAVWTSSGQVGGAMSFDGNLDVVKAGDVPDFDFWLDDFTLEAWVKWEGSMGTGTFGRIVSKQYPYAPCGVGHHVMYALVKHTNDKLTFRIQDCEVEVAVDAQDSDTIVPDTWYHIVGVRDGGNIYLYKNGVLVGSETSGNVGTLNPIGGEFAIGNYGITPQSSNAWNGKIDEVAVYDRALGANEILQHYNNGLANEGYCVESAQVCGNGIVEGTEECDDGNTVPGDGCDASCNFEIIGCADYTDMVAYWKLDEGQGTFAADSKDGFDGTLLGGNWDTGAVGNAISVVKDGNGVRGKDSFGLHGSTELSIVAWVKPEVAEWQTYFWKNYEPVSGWNEYYMNVRNDGRSPSLTLQNYDLSSNNVFYTTGAEANLNEWNFIGGTWKLQNFDASDVELYVNGAYVNDVIHWTSGNYNSNFYLHDDNYNWTLGHYLDGSVDEVAIFSRQLTEAELDNLYAKSLAGLGYCEEPVCGNGIVEGTEECDDGNTDPGDGCDAACSFEFEDCENINNLVSYWRLNENLGSLAGDAADDNDGTITGAQWTTGKIDSALSFSVDDYVTVPSAANLNFGSAGDFSITTWVNLDSVVDDNNGIISKETTYYGTGYVLTVEKQEATGKFRIYLHVESGPNQLYAATDPIDYGEWRHIAAVVDRDQNVKMYLDGQLNEVDTGITSIGNIDNSNPLFIGKMQTLGAEVNYDGKLDDMMIFNTALSEAEVRNIYSKGVSGENYCTVPVCGDGILEGSEECDDGNAVPGDGCSAACEVEEQECADQNGLQLYWSMDDQFEPGNDVFGGYDGQVYGSTWTANGIANGALDMDGIDDNVTLQSFDKDVHALSMWIKPDETISSATPCISLADFFTGVSGIYEYIALGSCTSGLTDEVITMFHNGLAGNYGRTGATGSLTLNQGEWYHLMFNYDNSASKYRIYLNGVEQVTTKGGAVSHAFLFTDANKISLGDLSRAVPTIGGSTDEFLVWDQSLTESQIINIYQRGLAGYSYCAVSAVCGNGILEGSEECDDGNAVDDDCCSNSCVLTSQGDGLISYWTFDDQSDPLVDDFDGNHGADVGGVMWTASGQVNGAMSFDGVNDYVEVDGFDLGQELTISFWINPSSSQNWENVIDLGIWGGWSFHLWDTEGKVSVGYKPGGVECRFGGESIVIPEFDNNEWNHFTYTKDATTQSLYLNGELYQTRSSCGNNVWPASFTFGGRPGVPSGWSDQFHGRLDEIAIYSRVLDEDEVHALYAKSVVDINYCAPQVCGNGILEGSEECDDGNLIDGDGCDSTCLIEPNTPPVLAGIPDVSTNEDTTPPAEWVDLCLYATDAEQVCTELTFTITVETNTALIDCQIVSNRYLECGTPAQDMYGFSDVTVQVDDGEYTDTDTLRVTVNSVNDNPQALGMTTVNLDEDFTPVQGQDVVALRDSFSDVEDGSLLDYTITSQTNPSVVSCAIDASDNIDCTAVLNAFGTNVLTIRATDNGMLWVEDTVSIVVGSVNDAPTLNLDGADKNIDEDSGLNDDLLNLETYAGDIEDGSSGLTYEIQSQSDPAIVSCAIDANNNLDCTTQPDMFGYSDVTIKVTDAGLLTATDTVRITVDPINDAPTIDGVPNQFGTEDIEWDLIVTPYIDDIDNDNANLIIFADAIECPSCVSVDDQTVSFLYTDGNPQILSDTITITVSDGEKTDEQVVYVGITPVDDSPFFDTPIPDVATPEDTPAYIDDLDDYVTDIDTPDSNLLWSASGNVNVDVLINPGTHGVTFSPEEDWNGQEDVTFTVTDTTTGVSDNMTITVTAVNDAPIVSFIPDVVFDEDTIFSGVNPGFSGDLDEYVTDVDTPKESISWTVQQAIDSHLTIDINPITHEVTITPDEDWNGAETITFIADDGEYTDSTSLMVTVSAVNDDPVLEGVPDVEIPEDTSDSTINLNDYTSDVDLEIGEPQGDEFEFTASVVPSGDVIVDISEAGIVTITPDENWFGTKTIEFTVLDGQGGSDTDEITLIITPVNDAPIVVDDMGTKTLTEDDPQTKIIDDLDVMVSDVDNTDNEMTWTYSGNDNMDVQIIGKAVYVTPDQDFNGVNVITFTATDPGLLSDSGAYTVIVVAVNDAPVVSDIPNVNFDEDTNLTAAFDLDDYVTDIDNELTELTWVASGNTEVDVVINPDNTVDFSASADWNGQETITFTVTDPDSGEGSDISVVTVNPVNDEPVITTTPPSLVVDEDTDYMYDVDAIDIDVDDVLSYSLLISPAGMTIDSASGLLEWYPTHADVGDHVVRIVVSDGNGGTDEQEFILTVQDPNPPILKIIIEEKPDSECTLFGWFSQDGMIHLHDQDVTVVHGCARISLAANEELSTYTLILESEGIEIESATDTYIDYDFDTEYETYSVFAEALDLSSNFAAISVTVIEDDDNDGVGDPDDKCPTIQGDNPETPEDEDADDDGCPDELGDDDVFEECLGYYTGSADTSLYPINAVSTLGESYTQWHRLWYPTNSLLDGSITVVSDMSNKVKPWRRMDCKFKPQTIIMPGQTLGVKHPQYTHARIYSKGNTEGMKEYYGFKLTDGMRIFACEDYNANTNRSKINIRCKNRFMQSSCDDACREERKAAEDSCYYGEEGEGGYYATVQECKDTKSACKAECYDGPRRGRRSCIRQCVRDEHHCKKAASNELKACKEPFKGAEKVCKQQCSSTYNKRVKIREDGKKTVSMYDLLMSCGYLEQSQCSQDLSVKIDFTDIQNTKNGNMDSRVFVGENAVEYSEGAWIPLTENLVPIVDSGLVEDVPGLSVKRGDGWVFFELYGHHRDKSLEFASGTITLDGTDFVLFRNDFAGGKVERQGDNNWQVKAGQDEVFWEYGSNTAEFYMTVVPHDDGFYLFYDNTCGII